MRIENYIALCGIVYLPKYGFIVNQRENKTYLSLATEEEIKNMEIKDISAYKKDKQKKEMTEKINFFFKTADQHQNIVILKMEEKPSGFAALMTKTLSLGEEKLIFVFRGTEDLVDWKNNFQLGLNGQFLGQPEQFKDAKAFVFNSIKEYLSIEKKMSVIDISNQDVINFCSSGKVEFTGHSLGGGLAQYMCNETGGRSYGFNGVGTGQLMEINNGHEDKSVNYVISRDVVGSIGLQYGKVLYLENEKSRPAELILSSIESFVRNPPDTPSTGTILKNLELIVNGDPTLPFYKKLIPSVVASHGIDEFVIQDENQQFYKMLPFNSSGSGFIQALLQGIYSSVNQEENHNWESYLNNAKNEEEKFALLYTDNVVNNALEFTKNFKELIKYYFDYLIDEINQLNPEEKTGQSANDIMIGVIDRIQKIAVSANQFMRLENAKAKDALEKMYDKDYINKRTEALIAVIKENKKISLDNLLENQDILQNIKNRTIYIKQQSEELKTKTEEAHNIMNDLLKEYVKSRESDFATSLGLDDIQKNNLNKSISDLFEFSSSEVYKEKEMSKKEVSDIADSLMDLAREYDRSSDKILNTMYYLYDKSNAQETHPEQLSLVVKEDTVNWETYKKSRPYIDPLVLDLNGDGLKTVTPKDGVFFDMNADGLSEKTGWISSQDAFLVLDVNHDGIINSGEELFGDRTVLKNGKTAANAIEALKDLDENKDGKIDQADSAYHKLQVWSDSDNDGFSLTSELKTLQESEVAQINLDATINENTLNSENSVMRSGNFIKNDGSKFNFYEVLFRSITSESIDRRITEISQDIKKLPDIKNQGFLPSLRVGMQMDKSGMLAKSITAYSQEMNNEKRYELARDIIFQWANVAGLSKNARGPHIDARELVVLEKMLGENFTGVSGVNPNNISGPQLSNMFKTVFDKFNYNLMAGTHLSELFSKINISTTSAINLIPAKDFILEKINLDKKSGIRLLEDFVFYAPFIPGINKEEYVKFREGFFNLDENIARVIDSPQTILVSGVNKKSDTKLMLDLKYGSDAADSFTANSTGSILYGLKGNDSLTGGSSNDWLIGGQGNDTLNGGVIPGGVSATKTNGNDIYVIGAGQGKDVILDQDIASSNSDTILFTKGISEKSIAVQKKDGDLIIWTDNLNSVTIKNHYSGVYNTSSSATANNVSLKPNKIEFFKFETGKILNYSTIESMAGIRAGSEHNDDIKGMDFDEKIYGDTGNDHLYGGAGNDTIIGGEGDDFIEGGAGNDTLVGGGIYDKKRDNYDFKRYYEQTSENINKSNGSDVYFFNQKWGQDIILNQDPGADTINTIKFGAGILPGNIKIFINGMTGELFIDNVDGSTIRIKNWMGDFYSDYGQTMRFSKNVNKIDRIEFHDGTIWSLAEIEKKAEGSIGNMISWQELLDRSRLNVLNMISGDTNNNTLSGSYGKNSKIISGQGNDTIMFSSGNNVYHFDKGDGHDRINFPQSPRQISMSNKNIIEFGDGIIRDDLLLSKYWNNLIISNKTTNDKIELIDFYAGMRNAGQYAEFKFGIDKIYFADGTSMDQKDILDKTINTVVGDQTNNRIHGEFYAKMEIYGKEGNDYLRGDLLDDFIDGGTGNDNLGGFSGSDVFFFDRSHGNDYIEDNNTGAMEGSAEDNDICIFNMRPDEIVFMVEGDNLKIITEGGFGSVLIKNQFTTDDWMIETFKVTGGQAIKKDSIKPLLNQVAEFESTYHISWNKGLIEKPIETKEILNKYWEFS